MKLVSVLLLAITCASAVDVEADMALFRNIFYTYARLQGYTEQQVNNLALYPHTDLVGLQDSSSLEEIEKVYGALKASDLIDAGSVHPFEPVDVERPLKQRVKPLTVIITPGAQGELFPFPFFESYNENSILAQAYATKLSATPTNDTTYSLYHLSDVTVPLSDLVKATSIDAEDEHRSLINLVWLTPKLFSLETIFDADDVRDRLLSRINKFLNLMRDYIGDIALMGYSRASTDCLDIMSHVKEDGEGNYWWASSLKAVISLQGANWGTPMTDCYLGKIQSDPPSFCEAFSGELWTLVELADKLKPDLLYSAINNDRINSALLEIARYELQKPSIPELANVTVLYPELSDLIEYYGNIVFNSFDITHPITGYEANIRRFQTLVRAFLDSATSLSTEYRLNWWRNHVLPSDVLYLALSTTQMDASTSPTLTVMHPDDYTEREWYHQMIMCGASELNDGLVPSARERFYPRLHMALNPKQDFYEAHWAGMVLAMHLGDTIDVVTTTPDGWVDPFPRTTLLKSLATWVAMNLN